MLAGVQYHIKYFLRVLDFAFRCYTDFSIKITLDVVYILLYKDHDNMFLFSEHKPKSLWTICFISYEDIHEVAFFRYKMSIRT